LAVGLLLGLVVYLLTASLPPQQRMMAAIFVLVIFYWVTEPLPLYVTAILAAFLSGVLLGPAGRWLDLPPIDYTIFLASFASPVVVLLFGGFVMANVFSKNNLDIDFCQMILRRLGTRPQVILFGLMFVTSAMSMWMSNTATTAIMVATVLPVVRKLPAEANLRRALMLGIPFAANIGGIATPIGTTPNAIAIGLLAENGTNVSFLAWMLAGFPVMLLLLGITYLLLLVLFPTRRAHFELALADRPAFAHRGLVYTTFFVTVLLWITDTLHGIPASLVSLVPVVVFAVTGLLPKQRLRELPWDILLLIGGGIALGVGIKATGLADTLAAALIPGNLPQAGMVLLLCACVTCMATFMSNTAASNIILPIGLSIAVAAPAQVLVPIAICASLGMALPVSTPPNAIAYGSELIAARDMLKTGLIVSILGVLITVAYMQLLSHVLPRVL
jgi:sodium-dependent dicarboxylate transporter 2/3/5